MDKLISLCMIVKDEQNVLERCLTSVKGLVDEIIVVDTGSNDSTKKIAKQFTDLVYDFKWCDDFSAARNASLEKATGKYILVLDADEYITSNEPTINKIRSDLNQLQLTGNTAFSISILNILGDGRDSSRIYESSSIRLFSNNGIRYKEPIHEQLIADDEIAIYKSVLTAYHTGYTEQSRLDKNKTQRNMNLMLKMKAYKSEDPYFLFLLGNEYNSNNQAEDALNCYFKSLSKSTNNDPWYSHTLHQLVTLLIGQREHGKAFAFAQQGLSLWPDLTDFHYYTGLIYKHYGFYKLAREEFEQCLYITEKKEQMKSPYWLIMSSTGKIGPLNSLIEMSQMWNDNEYTLALLTKYLKDDPDNISRLLQLTTLLIKLKQIEKVIPHLETLYPIFNKKNLYLLFSVSLKSGNIALTSYYYELCQKSQIPLPINDLLSYHLLSNNFIEAQSTIDSNPDGFLQLDTAIISALVFQNFELLERTRDDQNTVNMLKSFVRWAIATLNGNETDEYGQFLPEWYSFFLLQLLRFGYIHELNCILPHVHPKSINDFANRLVDQYEMEIAVDLLISLYDNDALDGKGLLTLGLLLFWQGNDEKGGNFFMQALQNNPPVNILGYSSFYLGEESSYYEQIKKAITNLDPFISNLSFT